MVVVRVEAAKGFKSVEKSTWKPSATSTSFPHEAGHLGVLLRQLLVFQPQLATRGLAKTTGVICGPLEVVVVAMNSTLDILGKGNRGPCLAAVDLGSPESIQVAVEVWTIDGEACDSLNSAVCEETKSEVGLLVVVLLAGKGVPSVIALRLQLGVVEDVEQGLIGEVGLVVGELGQPLARAQLVESSLAEDSVGGQDIMLIADSTGEFVIENHFVVLVGVVATPSSRPQGRRSTPAH